MNTFRSEAGGRRAFTLIELIAVVVVLAILSGVALPRLFDQTAKAREMECRAALSAVRNSIAAFYSDSAVRGSPVFPTMTELRTPGAVLAGTIPENPYNSDSRILVATWQSAQPPVSGTRGWCYDEATGKFWPNTNTVGENSW